MVDRHYTFVEMTDLYLQMLRRAQEIEDPKLISLILSRLSEHRAGSMMAEGVCTVIPFPIISKRVVSSDMECRFWPKSDVPKEVAAICAYLLSVLGYSIFS